MVCNSRLHFLSVTEPGQEADPPPQQEGGSRQDDPPRAYQTLVPEPVTDDRPGGLFRPLRRRPDRPDRREQSPGGRVPDGGDALPRHAELPSPSAEPASSAEPSPSAEPALTAEPASSAEPARSAELVRSAGDLLPQRGDLLPQRGDLLPQRGDLLPRHSQPASRQPDQPLPQRGQALPERGRPLPDREQPESADALPRRTGRTKPRGRHRSPHRLTVASDAPSLVLAIPGHGAASAELAEELAAATQLCCPGVDVRLGFLAGQFEPLDEALTFTDAATGELPLRAVVVPLLAGPHSVLDSQLADAVSRAPEPVMLAPPLGPHPLLAEVLHARLADVGLARSGRARGLSIVTGINGILVLADRGEEAVKAAAVSAVLLAARLAVPATSASLGDSASVTTAATRLRETGASRLAIAPCVIGPECQPQEIEAVAALLDAPSAPPMGAHPAIAQLIAMRYGAALARLAMASSAG